MFQEPVAILKMFLDVDLLFADLKWKKKIRGNLLLKHFSIVNSNLDKTYGEFDVICGTTEFL